MKKILISTLALTAALTLTACGDIIKLDFSGLQPSETPSQTPTASVQQQSTSTPQKSSEAAAADGMTGKLAAAYIDMFSSGTYYMKYRTNQEADGETEDVVTETAVNGDDVAIISKMESMSSHIVITEDKMYMIDHEEKTVLVMPASQSEQDGGGLPESGFVFKGAGTGELFGTPYAYEEYGTDSGDVRYFFDGVKLVGFESYAQGMTMQMEILEISEIIPSGMFDIPEDYEVIEY